MQYIYHYFAKSILDKIISSGRLKVSEWEKKNNLNPPALWLSTNPIWENTATKGVLNDFGYRVQLTKDQQFKLHGLARFTLEFKKEELCNWKKI